MGTTTACSWPGGDVLLAGGSFGRRAQQSTHVAIELAEVAKAIGPGKPIKLESPVADTAITVDNDGFILDYPGLAERI